MISIVGNGIFLIIHKFLTIFMIMTHILKEKIVLLMEKFSQRGTIVSRSNQNKY